MDTLQEAQELYNEWLDAQRDQRRQIEEDLKFSDPSDPQQWDENTKLARETDPGGARPCYVFDQTGQYVANVAGQVEKQPPSLHAIPVGGGADKQAAEQIDGRFRHIEHASRATQHYTRAYTSAARVGVGYLIVRPEIIDPALNWQEPRITSESDALRVVLDPWSQDTDGRDAEGGFLISSIADRAFERRWPGKAKKDFGELESSQRKDDRKSVLVAECWSKHPETKIIVVYQTLDGGEDSLEQSQFQKAIEAGQQFKGLREYKHKTQVVKWRMMSGEDVLEESEYPSEWIGIVPVYGYIGFADGRMKYCGIPRRAREPQQAYNYHASEATIPKGQLIIPHRALIGNGVKELWDRSRVERRAFKPYTDMDEQGAVAPPSVLMAGDDLINHDLGMQRALADIQASIGMYQANLGAESNETSGVAIESRKQQGEASTAHFPSHGAASLGQVGAIVMQMDARLADTQRKQPIIGVDGSSGSVSFDPSAPVAFSRSRDGVIVNPNVGKYSVRVVVGASYSTQRTQTNQAFAEVMRANKELAPVVAPFWAQTLDFPGSDKFAQALAAMAPPPVKAILQPEGQEDAPDPAAMAQENAQLKEALQEAIQHAKDAQEDADMAIAEAANAKRLAEVKERENDIKAYDAETNRLKVIGAGTEENAKAIVTDLINQMLENPDPLPGEPQPAQVAQPAQAEQPEPMGEEIPPEPPAPNPEIQAIQQGQQALAEMLAELTALTKKKRIRIPEYDKKGDIARVIDQLED